MLVRALMSFTKAHGRCMHRVWHTHACAQVQLHGCSGPAQWVWPAAHSWGTVCGWRGSCGGVWGAHLDHGADEAGMRGCSGGDSRAEELVGGWAERGEPDRVVAVAL